MKLLVMIRMVLVWRMILVLIMMMLLIIMMLTGKNDSGLHHNESDPYHEIVCVRDDAGYDHDDHSDSDHEPDPWPPQGPGVSTLADGYRRLAEELEIPTCLQQVRILLLEE